MKIEIDLDDVFQDEEGQPTETLSESIKRQIIDNIVFRTQADINKKIDAAIGKMMDEQVKARLAEIIPVLLTESLDYQYTPVSSYGSKSEPTTVRNELAKAVQNSMVYMKQSYASDKNSFTKAVDAAVEQTLGAFKSEWLRTVDAKFVQEAMDYAKTKLAERLGVKP